MVLPDMAKIPIMASPHVFYVRPAPGWLEVVFEEVTSIVKSPLQKYKFEPKITLLKSTVKIHRCDWRQGLEIMLRLTAAHDVEWLILESKCSTWSEVDAILGRVPWQEILPDPKIPVHVSADTSNAFSTYSGKLRENLCKIAGVQHVSEGGALRFKIELRGELLRISLSLCGDPLYKRGYKAKLSATAPLPEHQAAACIRWVLQGLKDPAPIVRSVFVPFAGSGTFGFEALLVLSGSGPGAFSRPFACDLFPCTPTPTMGFLRRKIAECFTRAPEIRVVFNDFHAETLSHLKENVTGFSHMGHFEVLEGDMFALKPVFSKEGKILVLLNPPYGDRLAANSDMGTFYARLGNSMRTLGDANKGQIAGGCICPDELTWRRFLKELDFPSAETHHFTHGGKEMRLVRWQF